MYMTRAMRNWNMIYWARLTRDSLPIVAGFFLRPGMTMLMDVRRRPHGKAAAGWKGKIFPPEASFDLRGGGTFRGGFRAREGITYAAYGNGPKPRIIGSPYDGAKTGDWTEVYPHVYRYSLKLHEDCGLLVFDDGKQHGRKITLHYGKRPVVDYITGNIF